MGRLIAVYDLSGYLHRDAFASLIMPKGTENSFRMFSGECENLITKYRRRIPGMLSDSFPDKSIIHSFFERSVASYKIYHILILQVQIHC